MQTTCTWEHALQYAKAQREKQERKSLRESRQNLKEERKSLREAKERIKPRSKRLKEAQDAFNAYIRERDYGLPCICCGGWPDVSDKYGGVWDAGHYLSVGSHPELRFDEDNCHKQLKNCNAGSFKFSRKGRVVSEGYEVGIRQRIGEERVERLRQKHPPKKYTIDDLIEIKQKYTRKRRELEKERL